MMGRTLEEMLQTLPARRRAAVERRADELIAEAQTLRELRTALKLTQSDMARRLNRGQAMVSRIENGDDLLLSTLHGYIKSLGGEPELVCRFKKRAAVPIRPGAPKYRAMRVAARRATSA
jgi:DNA-binding transcriptional regulator YiaG